jgi:hypothetical protein
MKWLIAAIEVVELAEHIADLLAHDDRPLPYDYGPDDVWCSARDTYSLAGGAAKKLPAISQWQISLPV